MLCLVILSPIIYVVISVYCELETSLLHGFGNIRVYADALLSRSSKFDDTSSQSLVIVGNRFGYFIGADFQSPLLYCIHRVLALLFRILTHFYPSYLFEYA